MENLRKRKIVLLALFLTVVVAIPLFVKNNYYLHVIVMVFIYSIVALSINLIVGFCGQLDFGRSAFLGLGGYWSALAMQRIGLPFLAAFISAGLVCAAVGMLLGFLCRKTSFDYLTLITIGFNEICRLVFLNWIPVTNGAMGLRMVPPPSFLSFRIDTGIKYFYFSLLLLIICYIAVKRITKSKLGRAFEALRDDPIAASYSGINVPFYKMYNFGIASFFTGIAGSALVHYTQYVSPYNYTMDESVYQLQMAIIGGLGSLPGSILGSAILIVVPEISRVFYQYRLLFVGLLMVVMMVWTPNGILGKKGVGEKIIGIRSLLRLKKKLGQEESRNG